MQTVSLAERPELGDDLPFGEGWPRFLFHDPVAARCLPVVEKAFPELSLVVLDGKEVVAGGWGVRIAWDATLDDLPAGWDAAIERAVGEYEDGRETDTLVTMAAEVVSARRGQGLSRIVLQELLARAPERVIAPVRPTQKASYPRMSMERYVECRRDDGLPVDPWLRTHVRLGGRILQIAPRSMVIEGTVSDWEEWTGMAFPESGDYAVPGALDLVEIDVNADRGRYVEPNVWVRHR